MDPCAVGRNVELGFDAFLVADEHGGNGGAGRAARGRSRRGFGRDVAFRLLLRRGVQRQAVAAGTVAEKRLREDIRHAGVLFALAQTVDAGAGFVGLHGVELRKPRRGALPDAARVRAVGQKVFVRGRRREAQFAGARAIQAPVARKCAPDERLARICPVRFGAGGGDGNGWRGVPP